MRPKDVLELFVYHFNRSDVDAISELYADDAVNHQVANDPIVGKIAIRKMFE